MDTYFIRHTNRMSIDSDTFERLWVNRKIAIHFPSDKNGVLDTEKDNVSLSPEDYKGHDAFAISTFVELANNGGYVCAHYRHRNECLIGMVEPKTEIEFIEGWWDDNKSRLGIFKSLQLKKVKVVRESQLAHILVGRPRQGTIRKWRLIGNRIEYLVNRKVLPQTIDSLLPSQQEVLCSEYLRLPQAVYQISHLLIPVGGTMKDIDIWGVDVSGQLVYAQVTFLKRDNTSLKIKLKQLKEYSQNGRNKLIMFCDCENQVSDDGIVIFPIREAFRVFTSTKSGKIWLEQSLR